MSFEMHDAGAAVLDRNAKTHMRTRFLVELTKIIRVLSKSGCKSRFGSKRQIIALILASQTSGLGLCVECERPSQFH